MHHAEWCWLEGVVYRTGASALTVYCYPQDVIAASLFFLVSLLLL